jgi:hypothetical protein
VSIEAWDEPRLWLRAEKSASSQELLDRLKIEVESDGDGVSVKTRYPNTRRHEHEEGRHMEVEYTLVVPRSAVIDRVELVNGDLKISGVEGGVRADTVNGRIVVDGFAGALRLESVNGNIDAHCGGAILSDELQLETVNGSVRVHLPAGASASVDVETVNGRISNDFGLQVNKHKYVGADMRGDIGGGGPEIQIETVNGAVSLISD